MTKPQTYLSVHGRQPPLAKHFSKMLADVVDYLDDRVPWHSVTLEVHLLGGSSKRFPRARDMAYVEQGSVGRWDGLTPRWNFVVNVSATLWVDGDKKRIEGVLRHELAHVVLLAKGKYRHTEQDADDLAEVIWGDPINYDADDIQTIGPGVHPRPARLPR